MPNSDQIYFARVYCRNKATPSGTGASDSPQLTPRISFPTNKQKWKRKTRLPVAHLRDVWRTNKHLFFCLIDGITFYCSIPSCEIGWSSNAHRHILVTGMSYWAGCCTNELVCDVPIIYDCSGAPRILCRVGGVWITECPKDHLSGAPPSVGA